MRISGGGRVHNSRAVGRRRVGCCEEQPHMMIFFFPFLMMTTFGLMNVKQERQREMEWLKQQDAGKAEEEEEEEEGKGEGSDVEEKGERVISSPKAWSSSSSSSSGKAKGEAVDEDSIDEVGLAGDAHPLVGAVGIMQGVLAAGNMVRCDVM